MAEKDSDRESAKNPTPEATPETVMYANYVAAHPSPFDIALDFANRAGPSIPATQVRIFMSWEHLSLLVPVLQAQLDAYQDQIGPLPNLVRDDDEGETP